MPATSRSPVRRSPAAAPRWCPAPTSRSRSASTSIGIGAAAAEPDLRENVIPAVVARNVFLGNSRDYVAEIGDGTALRIVTTPEHNIAQGSRIWLRLPADRCRVLER